ncbi:alpha/beta fold hydrolase [Ruania halotolerans]|uniref:alpha/beta fold hydrolase n=1 Tax=Ruania halotolerans TaxID=2897773 RepID=UPI001E44EA9B|nr:alpha/beta fold hydrolase [Ruania halotolerans]UFU07348.1 alpha/beta fold hydrolase [Ruania halotolerans]
MATVHHRQRVIDGHTLFYREAGDPDAPTLVLLHGYPTSSFMFRHLIPLLADDFHLIAPDHLGFGLSDAPDVSEFDYTFDALADLTQSLLSELGVQRYAIYVQDYGAPIGWRLAIREPEAVTAIISQSGNAYEAGFVDGFWVPVRAYWQEQSETTEAAMRVALGIDAIRWQYLTGVEDPTVVDPQTWIHDHALVSRPGNDRIQLALFRDYASNVAFYPKLHEYFRASQVPLLAVWGDGDEIFGPDGAHAFRTDLPHAEIHLVPGGHFLLESDVDGVAELIRSFLHSHLEGHARM